MRKQILLIDDDLPLCRQIRDALQDDTTEVRYFIDTAEALDSFMRHRYCLVIMDPVLEDMDGRELLRTMRQAKAVPILVLTDALSLEDEVAILSLGATVCTPKPIDLRRCTAQANALIRLYMESEHPEKQYYTLTFGTDLIIDPLHRQVLLKGSLLKLTRKEFNMLHFLASHPGQVLHGNSSILVSGDVTAISMWMSRCALTSSFCGENWLPPARNISRPSGESATVSHRRSGTQHQKLPCGKQKGRMIHWRADGSVRDTTGAMTVRSSMSFLWPRTPITERKWSSGPPTLCGCSPILHLQQKSFALLWR